MAKASIRPMKLRSGEWGIRVLGHEEEFERGTYVKVYTKDSDYIAIIRNLVFTGHDQEEDATVSLYGCVRISDDGCCPTCGTLLDTEGAEPVDFGPPVWKERKEGAQNNRSSQRGGFKKRRPENGVAKPKQEDIDDGIPF